jgi:hypothetical protein
MNKNLRIKLKTQIEGLRISRLSKEMQDELLKDLYKKQRTAKGIKQKKIDILISVILEKQEQAYNNQSYAE